MTNLNERVFARLGNRTHKLQSARLDTLPMKLTGPALCRNYSNKQIYFFDYQDMHTFSVLINQQSYCLWFMMMQCPYFFICGMAGRGAIIEFQK